MATDDPSANTTVSVSSIFLKLYQCSLSISSGSKLVWHITMYATKSLDNRITLIIITWKPSVDHAHFGGLVQDCPR